MRAAKIFDKAVSALTTAVLVICLLFWAPILFGIVPMVALSGSMEPAIPTGSIIYVDTRHAENVNVGDIVTYELYNGEEVAAVITHRIVSETGDELVTKGDANETEDLEPISRSQIYGKYLFNIPYLGYIYEAIGKKGRVLIAIWIVILNILSVISLNICQKLAVLKEAEAAEEGPQLDACSGSDSGT